ncbi:MAG: hypothetical protein ACLUKN_06450 [Bacilli bacterium]
MEGLKLRQGGNLGDIAPTVLQLMGLKPPAEMIEISDNTIEI